MVVGVGGAVGLTGPDVGVRVRYNVVAVGVSVLVATMGVGVGGTVGLIGGGVGGTVGFCAIDSTELAEVT
jgi:hypothetical protein